LKADKSKLEGMLKMKDVELLELKVKLGRVEVRLEERDKQLVEVKLETDK
jgi:hypothetical protein